MSFQNNEYLILVSNSGGIEEFVHMQITRQEVSSDGKKFPPHKVDVTDVSELGPVLNAFNLSLLKENVALKGSLQTQAALHVSQIASLNSAHSLAMSSTQAEFEQQKVELQTRLDFLVSQLPFNPRLIKAKAFLNRLTQAELLMLIGESDVIVQQIGTMLKDWAANDWHVDFESIEFLQAMGYLVATGRISEERLGQLTVDSSREESPG